MLSSKVQACMIDYNVSVFKGDIEAVPGVEHIDYRDNDLVNEIVDVLCHRMPVVPQDTDNNLCAIHATEGHLSVVQVLLHEERHSVELEESWPRQLFTYPVHKYYPEKYGCDDRAANGRLAQLKAFAFPEL